MANIAARLGGRAYAAPSAGSRFAILTESSAVAPYLETAMQRADEQRDALGFLPERVYRDACIAGKLFVAIAREQDATEYAGHLLFGGTFPFLRVFQVLVAPRFRRRKIASLLIQTLVKCAEDCSYLGINVRVAEDLTEANAFWEHEGFEIIRCKPGGKSKGRAINVRSRALDTPTLFGLASRETESPALVIQSPPSAIRPLYVIDVNVFLDLVQHRVHAEETRRLIAAAWNRSVDVSVTEEFVNELQRSTLAAGPDPVLDLAMALPRLPQIPADVARALTGELANVIFPAKANAGRLSAHDHSDLLHLATAIHHGAGGFVTGEKGILKHASELRRRFGIDVVGSAEFVEFIHPAERAAEHDLRSMEGGDNFEISDMPEGARMAAADFLRSLTVSSEIAGVALSSGASGAPRRRLQIRSTISNEYVAFASWDAPHRLQDQLDIYVFVDEDHGEAAALASHLFDAIAQDLTYHGPKRMCLHSLEAHARVRSAAIAAGFCLGNQGPSHSFLYKVAIGGVVTRENWAKVRAKVAQLAGLTLPDNLPAYHGPETSIELTHPDGRRVPLTISRMERLLYPALLALPDRSGVILPIRRVFAEHLFSGAAQLPLLPRKAAALSSDRVYFRSPRSGNCLKPGVPVVFYESAPNGGRAAAFACATVKSNRVMWADTVSERFLQKSVLDRSMIQRCSQNGLVSIVHFENVLLFQRPVPLTHLRQLGAVDGANLVTARGLSAERLAAIVKEGGALAL